MNELPFEVRRVINVLVLFWKMCNNQPDRVGPSQPIDELIDRCSVGRSFFRKMYHDLYSDRRSKYAGFSESEFIQYLETEYNHTTRAEPVELGRQRADLAPHTGVSQVYERHCWNCKGHISSAICARCSVCGFYICSSCGSCFCGIP
jgi:hypothetical protein